ncbi:MAG: SGNH/GDSL hydrolase family protein, partial [Spirochaetia bacterium]|nr:SGNH/GDSL hydrolase family protein [Spirochaetia bacterium]
QIKALTFFGDSITVGAQASGFYKDTAGDKIVNLPYAPLVFERVKKKFPASATLVYSNLAVGGKTSAWGVQNIAEVVGTNPDIAVIAFGMNDGSGKVAVEEYQDNTRKMIEAIRAANAETAIILIAEFSPNPDLALAHYDQRANNRNALRELFQSLDNAAFVDVGHVSRQIVAAKKFQDISGNNINHPNDFLHRIYADLVMKTFEEPR